MKERKVITEIVYTDRPANSGRLLLALINQEKERGERGHENGGSGKAG